MSTISDFFVAITFENQRSYPFSGWSTSLLPTDRYQWSSEDGKRERTKDWFDTQLPSGFRWITDWEVLRAPVTTTTTTSTTSEARNAASACPGASGDSTDQTDEEGWAYAFDFPYQFHPEPGAHRWVRRRQWKRIAAAAAVAEKTLAEREAKREAARVRARARAGMASDAELEWTIVDGSTAQSAQSPPPQQQEQQERSRKGDVPPPPPPPPPPRPAAEVRAENVRAHWEKHFGSRRGKAFIRVSQVHLPSPVPHFIEVSYRGTVSQSDVRGAGEAEKAVLDFLATVHVADDHEPIIIRVMEERRAVAMPPTPLCRGEAVLSLRTAPQCGATPFEPVVDSSGEYSEKGSMSLALFPPPLAPAEPPGGSGGVGDVLAQQLRVFTGSKTSALSPLGTLARAASQELGTVQVSWTFTVRKCAQTSGAGGMGNNNNSSSSTSSLTRFRSQARARSHDSLDRNGSATPRAGHHLAAGSKDGSDAATDAEDRAEHLLEHVHLAPSRKPGRLVFRPLSCENVSQQCESPTIYLVLHWSDALGRTSSIQSSVATRSDQRHPFSFSPVATYVLETEDACCSDLESRGIYFVAWTRFKLQSDRCVGMHVISNPQRFIAGEVAHFRLSVRPDERDAILLKHQGDLGEISAFVKWIPYTC